MSTTNNNANNSAKNNTNNNTQKNTTTSITTTITNLRLVVVDDKPIVWVSVSDSIRRIINGEEKSTDSFSVRYEKLLQIMQQCKSDILTGLLVKFNTPNLVVLNTLLCGAEISITQALLREGDEVKGLVIKKDVIKTSFELIKLPKIGEFTMSILMSSSKDDINLSLTTLCGQSTKAAKQAANIDTALAAI